MKNCLVSALAVLVTCSATAAVAEESRDLIHYLAATNSRVEQFAVSPEGSRIAYVSRRSDDNNYDLVVVNRDGRASKTLLSYPEKETSLGWSSDGKWIVFAAAGDVFKIAADGGKPPLNLTLSGGGNGAPRLSPDGKWIALASKGDIAVISTDIPVGAVKYRYLTRTPNSENNPKWSPDGKSIMFTGADNLWVVPMDGGTPRNYTGNTHEVDFPAPQGVWSPDGKEILFNASKTGWSKIYSLDVATGAVRPITAGEYDDDNPQWSPDGKSISFVRAIDWNFYIMTVPRGGGKPLQVTKQQGVNGGWAKLEVLGTYQWAPDGKSFLYTYSNAVTPSDIWSISAMGSDAQQLTNHMPAEIKPASLVNAQLVKYKSYDGLDVAGFLYKPAKGNGPFPLVVYARAGHEGFHANQFYPQIQALADHGYAVLSVEVRGSGANGRKYLNLSSGEFGNKDVDDAAAGVDYLVKQNIADPNRVGIQSQGTPIANMGVLKYPEKFKALINYYTAFDWTSFRDFSGGDVMNRIVATDPNSPLYKTLSPITYLDRLKAGVLLVVGDRDFSEVEQMQMIVEAMAKAGKPEPKVQVYFDEGHGWWIWRAATLEHDIRQMIEHYDKYLH